MLILQTIALMLALFFSILAFCSTALVASMASTGKFKKASISFFYMASTAFSWGVFFYLSYM